MINEKVIEKFNSKILKNDQCWIWIGYKNKAGYGKFTLNNGVQVYAHRLAWILNNGEIKDRLVICHHCDNPSCVNPDHLLIGTQKDNVKDMYSKGRQNIARHDKEFNPMFGKKHSKETLLKMSLIKIGKFSGSKHPRAKINELTVLDIRKLKTTGLTAKQVGEKLNVSLHIVRNILSNKSWKEIR